MLDPEVSSEGKFGEWRFDIEYFLHILILTAIFTTLAVSLDLLIGHTGLLSIAQAGFYGIGAYISALIAVNFKGSFLTGLIASIVVAALLSLIVSVPSMRLHDDYFVIATFGFQVIIFNILNNWTGLTHGPLGIPGIPRPSILGWRVASNFRFLMLAVGLTAFAYAVVLLFTSSPFGRVLRAIREDEVFVSALGKNPFRYKIIAFAVSAALAASAGSLYAHYLTYIDPTNFTVMESIFVISIVIIGGAGSRYGPLIGAVVLVSLPEVLRFIGLPNSVGANLRQIIYGALLIMMMKFRPRGLVGKYGFGR